MHTKLTIYHDHQSSNSCSAVSPFNNLSISIEASSFTSNLLHSDALQFVKLQPVMTMFGMLLLAALNLSYKPAQPSAKIFFISITIFWALIIHKLSITGSMPHFKFFIAHSVLFAVLAGHSPFLND